LKFTKELEAKKNSFKACANDELTRVGRRILEKMHRSKKSAQEKGIKKTKETKWTKKQNQKN